MNRRKVVMITCEDRPWSNAELAKDIGLVPYLFHRKFGCDVSMITGPGVTYTYAELLPGLIIEYISDNTVETKVEYLEKTGSQIDLLMLYGVTYHNIVMTETIKRVNPDCMITCALDMNIDFADRIPFAENIFRSFFEKIDLMWQSDQIMTDFLNKKWFWKVECERNGYYSLIDQCSDQGYFPFEKRNNTILYVGRINNHIKAVHNLIEAFAMAISSINGWKLKIVGPEEDDFAAWKEKYFAEHPELVKYVEFTGSIEDRSILHNEYEMAKVYASASRFEGGCPNSTAEALCSGCAIVITQISAYVDIIGDDEAGLSSPIDDVHSFAQNLIFVCNNPELNAMSRKAYKRGMTYYNMEKIVEEIYGKLSSRGF